MGSYFLDSSALVKRQVAESGHAWMRNLCKFTSHNELAVAEIALVEVIAGYCRMARENPPRLSVVVRDRLITRFRQHVRRQYIVVNINRAVLTRAADLCRIHSLRAFDAVQLACALAKHDSDLAAGKAPLVFVCADTVLLQVAAAIGLQTENPNSYP